MAAILLTFLPSGCESTEQKSKRQRLEQEAKTSKEMAEFSYGRNAVADWPQALKNKAFSIDVEPVFVRSDHRPILFYANLEDVRKQNDGIVLYFRTTPTEGEPSLQLLLDCGKCDLQTLKAPTNALGDFAVIAEAVDVTKVIDGTESSPDFVLRGKFVDARFVGDYAFDKELKQP